MRRSPEEDAKGAIRTFTSRMALSFSSSVFRTQSMGPTTAQRTLVSPIWTRELPLVPLEFVSGDIWIVIRRISVGFLPSFLRLDKASRSVLLNELMINDQSVI